MAASDYTTKTCVYCKIGCNIISWKELGKSLQPSLLGKLGKDQK